MRAACSSERRSVSTVVVEGIYSHFANADASGPRLGAAPARALPGRDRVVRRARDGAARAPHGQFRRHPPASREPPRHGEAGHPPLRRLPVRRGPSHHRRGSPALSWKSRVVYFKVVPPRHPVSYGSTWQTDHPVRVVTVPVGYGDGYFRALSNVAQVMIREEVPGGGARLHGPDHGQHRVGDRVQRRPGRAAGARTATRSSPARISPSGRAPSPYEVLDEHQHPCPPRLRVAFDSRRASRAPAVAGRQGRAARSERP